MSSTRQPPAGARGRAAGRVVAFGLVLAACGNPAVPAPTGTTSDDLEQVREEVADLKDRVSTLEDRLVDVSPEKPVEQAGEKPGSADEEGAFFGAPSTSVGEEVTVRGKVVEFLAATEVASAFRIAGNVGEPIAVVSVTPPPDLAIGDAVEVSGAVVKIDPDTFEADFGIAADELFDDPEAWLGDAEGQIALAAGRIEAVPTATE